jgi:hypothetical protein
MFSAAGHVFGGTEDVGSHFHVLRSRTRFQRCRVRRVSFSCFGRPNPFSAIPRASGPVFMFCAHRLVFGGTEGVRSFFKFYDTGIVFVGTESVGSLFHVFHSRTHFGRNRGRRVPFSCFELLDMFSAEPRASGPFFMFCAPELIFGGTVVVGPLFMFCAPGLVFGGTDSVGSRFHVLRARTHFRQYRGRRVPFSSFALLDSFSTVSRASGLISMFCAPGLVFGGTEGVGSCFHVLSSQTRFRRYRGRPIPFPCFSFTNMFSAVTRPLSPIFVLCAPGHVFGGAEGVGSLFHVLHSRTHFRRYRGRLVPCSYFALPNSFSAVPRASGHFHVLRSGTHFRRYRGRRVPFSCFALSDSFSSVPRVSGPDIMFSAA